MVGDFAGAVHIVGDDDAGDTQFGTEFIDQLIDAVRADGIQPGGGLVIQDDAGLEHDGAGEGDAFALSARELGGELVLDTFEVDQFEGVADFLQSFRRGERGVFDEREGDVVGDAHGIKESGELEKKADLQANRDQIALAELVDALIFDPNLATAGLQQADDVLQENGLATAGGAHDDGGLATGDVDVDTVQDDLRAKGAMDVDQTNGVTRGGGSVGGRRWDDLTGGRGRGGAFGLGRNSAQLCTLCGMETDARSPIRRTLIHKGRKFDYESVEYLNPSGKPVTRQVVRHPGAVVIVPILPGPAGEPHVVLIRSFRASLEQYILELPAGTREVGEEAVVTAGREIIEEIGYEAATLIEIGRFYTSPGLSDELMVAYAAVGLAHVGQRLEEDEDLTVQVTSVEAAFEAVSSGALMDAKSMLALYLARAKGFL